MTRRRFYIALGVIFLVGLVAIIIAPAQTLVALAIAVPVVLGLAVISTLYLVGVYRAQPVPRSRFFGMLLELFVSLLVLGLWVGYLTIARVMERAVAEGSWSWSLPAPPTSASAPISALIIILVFASPIRFAIEAFRVRRRTPTPSGAHETHDLDRAETGRSDVAPEHPAE